MKPSHRLILAGLLIGASACEPDTAEISSIEPVPTDVGSFPGGAEGGFGGGGFTGGGQPTRLTELRTAANPPPPISGGSMAISEDGKRVVIGDPDRDAVYVVELDPLKVQRVALLRGSEPGRIALDGLGNAHVALRGTGKLVRVDLAAASVVSEKAICTQPRGVAYDLSIGAVVTACMDGQLVTLDGRTYQEIARRTLPQDLRDVVLGSAGQLSLVRYRSAELLTLNPDGSLKSTGRPRTSQRRALFGPTRPGMVLPVPVDADAGTFLPVPPISPEATLVSSSAALAWRAIGSDNGNVWMLHQQSQDDEVVVSSGGYGSGCQTITSGAVTEFLPDGTQSRTMPIALQGLSVDAALSADEKWLAVASPGGYLTAGGTLQLYATANMTNQPSPEGCPNPALGAGLEDQVVAVGFGPDGRLFAFSREPAELQIFEPPTTVGTPLLPAGLPPGVVLPTAPLVRAATIALDLRSMRDTGHDLFHADVGQGLACASCHGEALDDGHVWTFENIGPRRTQNMRGGLLGTAPFHWDGDMMSIGHLVDEVMTRRMGGFQVQATYATALGQWINQQPALTLPASDPAAAARGKELFGSAQTECATCHSGTSFTNNASADVGTGGTFQVPGLLGLSLRPPFMHDGCAKTLNDRFDPSCGGGDRHGKTAKLSEAQRADLIAYLSSL